MLLERPPRRRIGGGCSQAPIEESQMPKRVHDGIHKRCDCGPRKWPKCRHPWHFRFHHAGKEHRYSLTEVARSRNRQPPVSKTEAETLRDELRTAIRSGRPVLPELEAVHAEPASSHPPARTFGDVADQYVQRHVRAATRRPRGRKEMEILISLARRAEIPAPGGTTIRLEDKPMASITRADIESVRNWRREERQRGRSRPGAKNGEVGINRLLSRLRHLFAWAVGEGIVEVTPFTRSGVALIKLERGVEGPRTQRANS